MIEFTLPDGRHAILRDPASLTVRQKRPLQVLISAIGVGRFQQIIQAQAVAADDDTGAALDALKLTRDEIGLLLEMTDATLYALVESIDGVTLPTTVDGMQDLPSDTYEALAAETAKLQADHIARNGFTVDAVEHPDSPTGASAESSL